jgi:hypothetical protein
LGKVEVMLMGKDWSMNDILHYIVVYGVILLAWVPVMDYWGGEVGPTAATVFVLFVVADKMAHKLFRI